MSNDHKYNRSTSKTYGWQPDWFGASDFDDELSHNIKAFQAQYGLDPDGKVGPMTYRRIFLTRNDDIDSHAPKRSWNEDHKHIVFNGNFLPIEWSKVVLWSEEDGLEATEGCYRSMAGKPPRDIRNFVQHWDVSLSSEKTQKILDKRRISCHFLVDFDGCIFQTMDMQDIAYHAGGRGWNSWSIGVEICNPFYLRWQSWYTKQGIPPRPLCKNSYVHGHKLEEHLGFYPVQIEACKALWKALEGMIPLQTPDSTTVYPPAVSGEYRGVIHHYHLKRSKIDCGGFDLQHYINEIKNESNN